MWRFVLTFIVLNVVMVSSRNAQEALKFREDLLRSQENMMLGSDIELSDSEIKANEIIMDLKYEVIDNGFKDPGVFNVSRHFFEYKDEVKETALFKIIQAMPKGAVLHAHDTGLLGPDYVLGLTYLPDLFVCFQEHDPLFVFSETKPNSTCETQWQVMKDARYSSGNVEKFDEELRKYFTIVVDNPREAYPNVNAVWNKFQQYFITGSGIFCYKPVWEQYFYDTLKALRDDNVMYVEIRSVLPQLYDLNGNVYDTIETAASYKKVLDNFLDAYPDFFGVKLIYAPLKRVDGKTVREYLKTAKELKKMFPTFFAGFDLVGQEDLGRPLKSFIPELIEEENNLDYFFHAGETNWYGTSSDENLIDAIVLNSRRIGHAYALTKYPVIIEEVKKRGIALEVNVLSNAVLNLVDDVRNHPLASFLAQNLPVVISSDDPGVWEADVLSHDFYVVFVGVASRKADLRLLKQLALNSLIYSAANNKDKLLYNFEIRWTQFIDSVVKDVYRGDSDEQ